MNMKKLLLFIPILLLFLCWCTIKVEQLQRCDENTVVIYTWTEWPSDNEAYRFMRDRGCSSDSFVSPSPADGYWNCYSVEKWCEEYCNYWELNKTDLCMSNCLLKIN